jgi:hypothetical protein
MNRIQLTVYFEDPFWVAVFERYTGNRYEVARHVFGAEPSEPEVYQLVRGLGALAFSRPVKVSSAPVIRPMNPKRLQRVAQREMARPRTSTRAQETLQREWENRKQDRQATSRADKDEELQRKFELRQLKRKEKYRGR